MTLDREETFKLFRFLIVTVVFPGLCLVMAIMGRTYARNVNRRYADQDTRTFFRSWVPIPNERDCPFFLHSSILRFASNRYANLGDPFLAQLTSHLQRENFDLSSTLESSLYFTPKITGVSPIAEGLGSGRQFASLFDFCRELLAHNDFVDEKRVLTRYWEAVHQERETADETEFDNYVAYVVDTYTIPAVLSFKEGRVVRAEDLLVKASERLQLIPMTPLQFESRDSDFLRNATLILAAFLEDRTAVVLQQASFRKAVDCLLSKLPPAARNDWVIKESTAPPRAIEAFMLAVYLLDELRYEDCIAQTAKVLSARPSPRLLQITLLMQLQSELKRRERLKPTKIRNSLVNLRNVYATLDQSPYASQLKYYREKLGQ